VGAIAHAGPHCLAVAARSEQWSGLGIDVEQEQELAPGLQRKILTDPERRHLEGLPAGCSWPIAAFSAKEAVFKAWHPRTRRWLDFHDVEICFTPEAGTFEARLLVDDPIYLGRRLERAPGRFLRLPGRVVTSVALS
jgi:4'-phosphopantetheinyl transferase EntD